MSAHTPGPWVEHMAQRDSGDWSYLHGPDGCRIATIMCGEEDDEGEAEANASLFKVAPELLEACRLAADWIEDTATEHELPLVRALRSVIKKATGGNHDR